MSLEHPPPPSSPISRAPPTHRYPLPHARSTGLYTGNVIIYHVDTGVRVLPLPPPDPTRTRAHPPTAHPQAIIKTFEVTEVPVRCVRFIARKNWFVCGSDDFHLRVFNYNTGEKVTALEAHPDYIRCLAVHPTQPLVLTGSDDMTIKLWDWEKGWKCIQVRLYPALGCWLAALLGC